jgi:hypothetical protein
MVHFYTESNEFAMVCLIERQKSSKTSFKNKTTSSKIWEYKKSSLGVIDAANN